MVMRSRGVASVRAREAAERERKACKANRANVKQDIARAIRGHINMKGAQDPYQGAHIHMTPGVR